MLTHHMDANSMMPLTYPRDNLTALRSQIFRVLTAIRNFEFNPDHSNATRIYWENQYICEDPGEPEKTGKVLKPMFQAMNILMKVGTSCVTNKSQPMWYLVTSYCTKSQWWFT